MNRSKTKTKNEKPETPEASDTTDPADVCTRRAELIEILSQFNFTVEDFDRQRSDSFEQQLAARSPRLLEQLYLALLKPGIAYQAFKNECPRWPQGHPLAGRLPGYSTVRQIADRLAAARKADSTLNLERRKLLVREKDLRLREAQIVLDREKMQQQRDLPSTNQTPALPDEPYDPELENQKVIALTKKIYGDDIFN